MTHTFQTVSHLIHENLESDLPDKVLEALRPWDGKMVTTRIVDKLPGGKDEWRLRRQYGMTHIESNSYWKSDGNKGISLLLAHSEASFPFSIKDLEDKNPAYFDARKKRNHARMEVINNKPLLDKMASVLNRLERAKAEMIAAFAAFDELTEYGAPFDQDRYRLERVAGMRVTPRGSGETRIQLENS